MLPPQTCTAQCWPEGSTWVVHVPELGRSARASRLSQVEGVARDLVTSCGSEDPATLRVVVDLRVRHSVNELISAAAALREQPDRVSVGTVTLRRCLARRLAAEGFDARDVAALLGLSYGRTLQLLGDHGPGRRVSAPLPAPAGAGRVEPPSDLEPAPAVRAHDSYRHEAFLYRGAEQFLSGAASFVRDGLALGQPVMVALVPERLEPLREALPAGAPVYWVDMAELGANPARLLPALRQFLDEHGGPQTPVRGLGEPVWAGRRTVEVVECQLHEALLNVAVEPDTPLWLRCPYDAAALEPAVVEEASRSHPVIVDDDDYRGSLLYGGVEHVASMFGDGLPAPRRPVDELLLDESSTAAVRPLVLAHAADAGLPASRTAEVALAVTEAAANRVRHGGGQGCLRVWQEDGALVCEVRDTGRIDDPLVGRRMPSVEADGGRGLWLVNQLSDLVQVRSDDEGTAVRVHTWLAPAQPEPAQPEPAQPEPAQPEPAQPEPRTVLDLREAPVACGR